MEKTITLSDQMTKIVYSDHYYAINIHETSGKGTLRVYQISPDLLISFSDFALTECPLLLSQSGDFSGWLSIHSCFSGRSEVKIPSGQTLIIKPGDCCVSSCLSLPDKYSYPLSHYKGMEILISSDFIKDSACTILREENLSLKSWIITLASSPVIFENEGELSSLISTICDFFYPEDTVGIKLRVSALLHQIDRLGLPLDHPAATYTDTQIAIARETWNRIMTDPDLTYDLKEIADGYDISTSSLNNYFRAVYGDYIPTFMRSCRLKIAATLLTESRLPIYEIAARAGYANASKFSSAFRKVYHCVPSVYRQKYRGMDS